MVPDGEWVEGFFVTASGELYTLGQQSLDLFHQIKKVLASCEMIPVFDPKLGALDEIEVTETSFRYAYEKSDVVRFLKLASFEHAMLYKIVYTLIEEMKVDDTLPYRDVLGVGQRYMCLTNSDMEAQAA